ncbi:MAG: UMP kinase [Anaerolineaceae bacterium]|nr:UMP kinase [Anaerolineaceae bacterium]
MAPASIYRRIVLKLSGEALAAEDGHGIDPERADDIARKLRDVHELGVQIAVVIGGGNLWRGTTGVARGMDEPTSHYIGMVGTVMNALTLQDALERLDVRTRVQTAVQMNAVAEPYIRLRAIRHLEKSRVVILAGGLGNPYFTTDTAAALRASEISADIVIKATKVNGIYSADPVRNPDAQRFERLNYGQVLRDKLEVMDMTAFTVCEENQMPILVINFFDGDDLLQAVKGRSSIGTLVCDDC